MTDDYLDPFSSHARAGIDMDPRRHEETAPKTTAHEWFVTAAEGPRPYRARCHTCGGEKWGWSRTEVEKWGNTHASLPDDLGETR